MLSGRGDDNDNLDDAFQQLEQKQVVRLLGSVVDVSNRIYATPPVSSDMKSAQPASRPVPVYYSEGYDATHDSVDERELSQWRSNFHWLRVVGTGMVIACKEETDNFGLLTATRTCAEDEWYVDDVVCKDLDDGVDPKECLVVTGKSCTLHPLLMSTHEDFCDSSDGILEEYLECNDEDAGRLDLFAITSKLKCNKTSSTLYDPYDSINPSTSIKEEVIASLVDMMWPDVTCALKPIVQKVLAVAQENCIPANIKRDDLVPSGNEWNRGDDDGFLFAEGGEADTSW